MAKDTPTEQYLAEKVGAESFQSLQPVCKGILRTIQSQKGEDSEFKRYIAHYVPTASMHLNSDFEWFAVNLVKGLELGIREAGISPNISELSIGKTLPIENKRHNVASIWIDPINKVLALNPEVVADLILGKNLIKERKGIQGETLKLTGEESIQLLSARAVFLAAKQMQTGEQLRLLLGKTFEESQQEFSQEVEEKTLQALEKIRSSPSLRRM